MKVFEAEKRDMQTYRTPFSSFLRGTSTNPVTHTHTPRDPHSPFFTLCRFRLGLPFSYLLFVILLKLLPSRAITQILPEAMLFQNYKPLKFL